MGLSTAFWNDTGVVSPYCGKTVYLTNPSTGKKSVSPLPRLLTDVFSILA